MTVRSSYRIGSWLQYAYAGVAAVTHGVTLVTAGGSARPNRQVAGATMSRRRAKH
jgi:hypothetical protein